MTLDYLLAKMNNYFACFYLISFYFLLLSCEQVTFENGQGNSHTVVDEEARVTVRRESKGVLSRSSHAYEGE